MDYDQAVTNASCAVRNNVYVAMDYDQAVTNASCAVRNNVHVARRRGVRPLLMQN